MNSDFLLVQRKLYSGQPFSLIRFGDGEYNILGNIPCKRKGFEFNPNNLFDSAFRADLTASLIEEGGENYFVGIPNTKTIQNTRLHNYLKSHIKGTIIGADVFINENYISFLTEILATFDSYDIILVANAKSDISKLPFPITKFYAIMDSAWRTHENLYETILLDLEYTERRTIVLVAGGPYSCHLIHQMWQLNNKHTYLDIGSTLDPWFFYKYTRKYHERLDREE